MAARERVAMGGERRGGGVHGVDRKSVITEIGHVSEAWRGRSGTCHDDKTSRTDDHCGGFPPRVALGRGLPAAPRGRGGGGRGINTYSAIFGRTPPNHLCEV